MKLLMVLLCNFTIFLSAMESQKISILCTTRRENTVKYHEISFIEKYKEKNIKYIREIKCQINTETYQKNYFGIIAPTHDWLSITPLSEQDTKNRWLKLYHTYWFMFQQERSNNLNSCPQT